MATIDEILKRREIWSSAVANGDSLEQLAKAACEGCRAAVSQLGSQLLDMGYPHRNFILPGNSRLAGRMAKIEKHTGRRIPAVLREFWTTVGGVSFVNLKSYKHVEFWDDKDICGAKGFCDGVHVDACDNAWMQYAIDEFDSYSEDVTDGQIDADTEFCFTVAPDGYHKDDISGGEPYALGNNSDWAPTFKNFEWTGYKRPETAVADPPDFLSYLRTAILECAGFPGLFGHPGFEPIRESLVRDLHVF